MNKKVKLAIIGLGQRGFTLIRPITATKMAEIVAVRDVYDDRI